VVACRLLRLPPMLGYLCVGMVIGPHALALSQNVEAVQHLGEMGVVFLMFVIGLEFNLQKLRSMRRHVFGLGLLQVALTLLLGTLALLLLAWLWPDLWDMGWRSALSLGAALTMSSTAIVVKLLVDRLEMDAEHGRRIMGVLLFQDLAVVPLLVLVPALAAPAQNLWYALALAAVKATLLITVLLVGGQHVMRRWLTLVAQRKSNELFVLNLLLIALGLAWLTEQAGLSLALGAFIAGMLISETEFKHQVETDIRPFHDVLLGLFFIGIGMLLDWRMVLQNAPLVLLLALLPPLFKMLLITGIARALGNATGVALRTGLYLGQAGEFGFVLLALAGDNQLVPQHLQSPILAAMVLSMLATPFVVQYSNHIVLRLVSTEWMQQSLQLTTIARQSIHISQHIIIAGFGRCGQNLGRVLEAQGIAYLALDLDPERVRQASAAGHAVVYGDSTRLQALMAAGLARASAVVVTYLDEAAAFALLAQTQEHAPQVPVIVRTQDDHSLEKLQAAGATEVVPEAIEGSLMLASHALALVGVPMRRVIRIVQDQRDARYAVLRGYFHGSDDDSVDELEQERLHSVTLHPGAHAASRPMQDLPLAQWGVRVVHLRRADGKRMPVNDTVPLAFGDTLVLSGKADDLARAEQWLLGG
ncbi:MAG: cation:proton antiporter, partial [Rhodoferax sp.]|nr:cation:proton antiporter [Rhodoferax sp.]